MRPLLPLPSLIKNKTKKHSFPSSFIWFLSTKVISDFLHYCKMKFQSVSACLGLFFGIAVAQSTTTSSLSSSSTGLPTFVSQLPTCALDCLPTVGTEIGCAVGDFKCLCSSGGSLVAHMGTCILKKKQNTCSTDDVTRK